MSCIANLRVPIEKQHTCAACGCVFRYLMQKNVIACGTTQRQAQANLPGCVRQQMAIWQQDPESLAEKHPCPDCGLVQPGMVSSALVSHASAAGFAFICLLFLLATQEAWKESGISLPTLAVVGIVLLGGMAAFHLFTLFSGPNRNRQANREQAQQEVATGVLTVVSPGDQAAADRVPPRLTAANLIPTALVILAPLACGVALVVQAEKPEPASNAYLRPAVVSPGETCGCVIPNLNVQGLGHWRGQPTVRVLNAKEVGAPEKLDARGNEEQWGSEVSVWLRRFERPADQPLCPMIRLSLPNNPALAGKTLQLQVSMKMTYAVLKGRDTFENKTASITSTFPVTLATPESLQGGPVFLFALAAGCVASALGGLWLGMLVPRGSREGSETFFHEPATGFPS
jgi:hypothetical protein